MKNLLISLAVVALAGSASAQTTYLSEDFDAGVIPPAGWSKVNNNGSTGGIGWEADLLLGRAWHQDEFATPESDNSLVSPSMDLSAAGGVYLHFDGETRWANYLANHPSSVGNGVSTMEVSTDGGVTWTVEWTDTSTAAGSALEAYSPTVDLSAYAGNSNVQLSIHFYGDFAQEWWVDNVVIDDQPGAGGPTLAISGTCPGVMTISASGLTAGGPVAVVQGPAGVFVVPGGSCAGVTLDIAVPTLVAVVNADGSGDINGSPTIPAALCGATMQMLDLTACVATNSVVL